ncbi:uncharacterized protein ARMOST_03117 [Armillaria ostoyae]|uniref:Uncharacterized protein n=1 Tax=Armillaria ostoyae TaxID=47428 RepID=A0A284QTK5_ARMOS|nr:uncharacterized protein ARMOST_03117 [Armillaria ostoyae]
MSSDGDENSSLQLDQSGQPHEINPGRIFDAEPVQKVEEEWEKTWEDAAVNRVPTTVEDFVAIEELKDKVELE